MFTFPPRLKIFLKIVVKAVGGVETVDNAEKMSSCLSLLLRIRQWIKKLFFHCLHSSLKKQF
jgi:hypothetical protein